MPYKNRIRILEDTYNTLEKKIENLSEEEKQDKDKVNDFREQKSKIYSELSRLRKLQWEEDHERVNFDDER